MLPWLPGGTGCLLQIVFLSFIPLLLPSFHHSPPSLSPAKLVPIAFGIKKLQISCVVEDEKVSKSLLFEAGAHQHHKVVHHSTCGLLLEATLAVCGLAYECVLVIVKYGMWCGEQLLYWVWLSFPGPSHWVGPLGVIM